MTTAVAGRLSPIDLALGATSRALGVTRLAAHAAAAAARGAAPVVQPLVALGRRTPVPDQWRPGPWLATLSREGAAYRAMLLSRLTALLDALVPVVLAEVLGRADLTDLVLRFVDLDEVVAAVDLDRAVARVDVDAVVTRVDADAVVAKVDLNAIIDRVDVDAVANRLDVELVLDRMDLTSTVLQRVDLDALVQAILLRIDLIGLAEQVIDGVNLTEIIRESTGTMASDTVRGVRMQGIAADDAISHAMDRFLLRHGRRSTKAPDDGGRPREPLGEDNRPAPSERVP